MSTFLYFNWLWFFNIPITNLKMPNRFRRKIAFQIRTWSVFLSWLSISEMLARSRDRCHPCFPFGDSFRAPPSENHQIDLFLSVFVSYPNVWLNSISATSRAHSKTSDYSFWQHVVRLHAASLIGRLLKLVARLSPVDPFPYCWIELGIMRFEAVGPDQSTEWPVAANSKRSFEDWTQWVFSSSSRCYRSRKVCPP